MTQVFNEDKKVIPVTLIEAGPCFVTQINENSVQIGFERLRDKLVKSPQKDRPYRHLREQSTENAKEFKTGMKITLKGFEDYLAEDYKRIFSEHLGVTPFTREK